MKKWLFFLMVIGVLVLILQPQFRSFEQMGERRFQELSHPAKEIVVGVCWPFSVNQDGMADGLELALDEINTQNMAGEYTLHLVIRDNAFDLQKGNRIAVEFADTPNMSAVIGYYDDSLAVISSPIFEVSRLLHIIVGANNTAMTSHDFQYIVRTTLSSDKIGQLLSKMSASRGYRKVALIWEEDAYGEDLAYQYQVGLDSLNIQVAYKWSYSREYADFRKPVNELKGLDIDAVIFAGLEPWAGDFLRSARGVGVTTPIIGAFSDTPEMHKHAGQALEGAMYFEMYNVDSPNPENTSFVQKFSARYGKKPDTWAAQGYDALHILARAVKATGARNSLDLAYAIRYMDRWQGTNGWYKFNNEGNLEDKPIFLMKFQDGIPVMVQ
jgi:branched-chain amino acid transport system substrate-binding protein